MSSTLATGFMRHAAQAGGRQTLVLPPMCGSTSILSPLCTGSFKDPHPAILNFWSSLPVSERTPTLVSFCQSHIDLLQLLVSEEELEAELRSGRKTSGKFSDEAHRGVLALSVLKLKASLVTAPLLPPSAVTSQ